MDWILAAALIALLPALLLAPNVLRILAVRRLRAECSKNRTLVLTYDDGPSQEFTPRLLEVLAERDVRATFFMTGRQAEENPETVDQVLAAGHEVGCHSGEHLCAFRTLPWRAAADVGDGYKRMARWIKPNACYRPPYGRLNLLSWLRVVSRRAPLGWWTVDSGDSFELMPDPAMAARSIKSTNGGVVLLHDRSSSEPRNQFVLDATRLLLDVAESEGLRVAPMAEIALPAE